MVGQPAPIFGTFLASTLLPEAAAFMDPHKAASGGEVARSLLVPNSNFEKYSETAAGKLLSIEFRFEADWVLAGSQFVNEKLVAFLFPGAFAKN